MSLRLTSPLLVLLLLAVLAPSAHAARPLQLGFQDNVLTGDPTEAAPWLGRAVGVGTGVARISTGWGGIAANRPADPTDPADPAYNWTGLDQGVRNLVTAGIRPLISLTGAPAWAEGADKPASAASGAWKPDAAAFGQFAQVLARRYDGTYPDPLDPSATLPRVTAFQPWNEPNLDLYLAPQWTKKGGHFVHTGPVIYRGLQNAFYSGIKAAQPSATVVTGGTSPFGDPQPGGARSQPARFWRDALCLTAKLKKACNATMRFDAIAHHPYSVGAPTRKAINSDDVSIPDLRKITRPVAAAVRLGRALPKKAKALWITEVSYDSSPPDPDGVPAATQARWLQQAFALLWQQGASVITWFQIRDQEPVPSYGATNQSGIFLRDGTAKPSATAFAFPTVVLSKTKSRLKVFLRAPAAGTVTIERRVGSTWRTAATVRASRHAVVVKSIPRAGASAIRARQGDVTSLAWTV